MTQVMGASVPDQALAVPATPLRVDGPSGFDPSRIGKEKCWCGHPSCRDWWLTGIGKFSQGSGFSEDEADLIIAALKEYGA